jgi:hypothetical protein
METAGGVELAVYLVAIRGDAARAAGLLAVVPSHRV